MTPEQAKERGIKVKPLVWRDNTRQGVFADTVFGTYAAIKVGGLDAWYACFQGVSIDVGKRHGEIEAACVACRPHYEARILDALE